MNPYRLKTQDKNYFTTFCENLLLAMVPYSSSQGNACRGELFSVYLRHTFTRGGFLLT